MVGECEVEMPGDLFGGRPVPGYVRDKRAGSALGVLELAKVVTAEQRAAGESYARLVRRFQHQVAAPGQPAAVRLYRIDREFNPPNREWAKAKERLTKIEMRLGADREQVRAVAVENRLPTWFIKPSAKHAQIARRKFVAGLDRLT